MPDFERVMDSLREHAAKTPEDRAWARGYAAGKTRARRETLVVVVFVYFAIAAVGRFFGA